jgi:hypothetical protein
MKPVFEHDCKACVYLGTIKDKRDLYDLYYCPADLLGPTVIARWSSNGPDYMSGMVFGKYHAERDWWHPFGQAYMKARERGLISDAEHEALLTDSVITFSGTGTTA